MENTEQRRSLDRLTSLRYLAALAVVAHHVGQKMMPEGLPATGVALGYVGVGFFYVLSGFILTWTYNAALERRHFYGRRFARVYPMHLITALATVPVLLWLGHTFTPATTATNLLLVHAWVPDVAFLHSLNTVSWSLACEAFFYAVFPFLVVHVSKMDPRTVVAVVGTSLVLVAAVVAFTVPDVIARNILYYFPAYRLGEFVIGMALAIAMQRGWRLRVPARFLVAWAVVLLPAAMLANGLVVSLGAANTRVVAGLLFVPLFVAAIVDAATRDLDDEESLLTSRWFSALGSASFALYLIHYIPLVALNETVGPPSSQSGGVAFLLGFLVLSTAASVVVYQLLEKPLEKVLRRRLGGVGTQSSPRHGARA